MTVKITYFKVVMLLTTVAVLGLQIGDMVSVTDKLNQLGVQLTELNYTVAHQSAADNQLNQTGPSQYSPPVWHPTSTPTSPQPTNVVLAFNCTMTVNSYELVANPNGFNYTCPTVATTQPL